MPQIKALSCDAHGTLILPQPSVGVIYADYAQAHGYTVSAAALEEQFVPAFTQAKQGCALAYGKTQEDARVFWHQVIRHTFLLAHDVDVTEVFCDALFYGFGKGEHWYILTNVIEMLDFVRSINLPVVLCSNFDGRVRGILRDLQLDHYFDEMFISAELGMAKPDPGIMERISQSLGCAANEILHIGNHKREDGALCQASGAQWFAVDEGGQQPLDLSRLKSIFAD